MCRNIVVWIELDCWYGSVLFIENVIDFNVLLLRDNAITVIQNMFVFYYNFTRNRNHIFPIYYLSKRDCIMTDDCWQCDKYIWKVLSVQLRPLSLSVSKSNYSTKWKLHENAHQIDFFVWVYGLSLCVMPWISIFCHTCLLSKWQNKYDYFQNKKKYALFEVILMFYLQFSLWLQVLPSAIAKRRIMPLVWVLHTKLLLMIQTQAHTHCFFDLWSVFQLIQQTQSW